jgi:peptide deformylase
MTVMSADPAPILLLGDPVLRRRAQPVGDPSAPPHPQVRAALHGTLADFRARHGFGRGLAAPQIGHSLRMVALQLDGERHTLHDPEITWRSAETFTLWDDCLSFPWLLVRVERASSISVRFVTEDGRTEHWQGLPRDLSELLQHEIDHLDGVLTLDRAVPADRTAPDHRDAVISRAAFDRDRDRFLRQVG